MQLKKSLYVPRVEDKNSHMRMLKISSIDDLVANSMNILEPLPVDAAQNEREDGRLSNIANLHFLFLGLLAYFKILYYVINFSLPFGTCITQ